jgi:cytochrome c-type biogenesis protein CcmH/NrfG
MLAFEEKYRTELSPEQSQQLKMRIADAYAAQGVAAEDRKDIPAATDAYRKGLEWNPNNVKARFNLAAIYLDDRKFKEAETEFRALLKGTPNDYESHYWLSETILAQRPGPIRRAEACRLLKEALAIEDAAKRAHYEKRLASLKCPQ